MLLTTLWTNHSDKCGLVPWMDSNTLCLSSMLRCIPVEKKSQYTQDIKILLQYNKTFQDTSLKERGTVSPTEVKETFFYFNLFFKLMCMSLEWCRCSAIFTCLIKYWYQPKHIFMFVSFGKKENKPLVLYHLQINLLETGQKPELTLRLLTPHERIAQYSIFSEENG